MNIDDAHRDAFIAWLRGEGPQPETGEPMTSGIVAPVHAVYEISMEGRRAWAARPHTYALNLDEWDDTRLLGELMIEIQGLVAFLPPGMVDADGARVAAVGISAIVSEMRSRRRKAEEG